MSLSVTVDLHAVTCVACGTTFAIEEFYYKALVENHNWFKCPNGHDQHFAGKTEAEKLREELNKVKRELADIEHERAVRRNKLAQAREAKKKKLSVVA